MSDIQSILNIQYADALEASNEARRPSRVWRPALMIDGDQWCALYGANLQDGVAGFGDSPAAAMEAFDRAWKTPLARAALSPKEGG